MTRREILQAVCDLADRANTESPGTPEWREAGGMLCVLQALAGAGHGGRAGAMMTHVAPWLQNELNQMDAVDRRN